MRAKNHDMKTNRHEAEEGEVFCLERDSLEGMWKEEYSRKKCGLRGVDMEKGERDFLEG